MDSLTFEAYNWIDLFIDHPFLTALIVLLLVDAIKKVCFDEW